MLIKASTGGDEDDEFEETAAALKGEASVAVAGTLE